MAPFCLRWWPRRWWPRRWAAAAAGHGGRPHRPSRPDQLRALVATTDQELGKMVTAVLQRHRQQPITCRSVLAAQRAITTGWPGLVIVDWRLPGDGARQLVRMLRRNDNRQPVSVLALVGSLSEIHDALLNGADDYLAAPVDADHLDARLTVLEARWAELATLQTQQQQAQAAHERLQLATGTTDDGIWDWSITDDSLYRSRSWFRMLGLPPQDLDSPSAAWFELVHEEDLPGLRAAIAALQTGDAEQRCLGYRIRFADGRFRQVRMQARVGRGPHGPVTRIVGRQTLADEATGRQETPGQARDSRPQPIHQLSGRDELLDLLRRARFTAAQGTASPVTVLLLAIDRLHAVTTSLGFRTGDLLLQAAARRLRALLPRQGDLRRVTNNRLVIVVEGSSDIKQAIHLAERCQRQLRQPFQLDGTEVFATLSIGIARWHPGHASPDQLLRDAETAMQQARARGGDRYEVFTPAMHEEVAASLSLERDLRLALGGWCKTPILLRPAITSRLRGIRSLVTVNVSPDTPPVTGFASDRTDVTFLRPSRRRGFSTSHLGRNELEPYFQPIVSLAAGRLLGFEALARWRHPTRGLLSPGAFLPVAEKVGLVIQLDRLIAAEACRQLRQWQVRFRTQPPLRISVNISTSQLMHPDLVSHIDYILRTSGLYGRSLDLEVTEGSIMEDVSYAAEIFSQLRALDIGISIDDFGTGYSSLAYLRRFEADTIKIDCSFVGKMLVSDESLQIVRAIVHLARNLGKQTVAEGVETVAQCQALQTLGIDSIQGNLVAPPLAASAAADLVERSLSTTNLLQPLLEGRHRGRSTGA